ncbi:MAG TPA: bacterial transcriptional activator domain-containing protein, partial [Jatrophihabitantaceae bacterium]|nr:bacterial transcriptional activator domain-containing protein [Jatrophihabitantaceae bacterium]
STVRKVLDPERDQPTDHYIAADARALTLRTDHVRVDVTEFFAAVADAVRAADQGDWTNADRKCADAELLYRGDFLEEDRYEDWALDCRERARTTAGTAVRLRARAARERGDREAASMYLLRLVDRDPYDEDSWTALIALQTQLRRHGEARRLYSMYSRRMDELDIAPAPFAALSASAR